MVGGISSRGGAGVGVILSERSNLENSVPLFIIPNGLPDEAIQSWNSNKLI